MGVPTVLTRDAHLNIEADLLAKRKAETAYEGPLHYRLPGNKWACHTAQGRVVKQFDGTIRLHINGPPTKEYWKTKDQLTETTFESIDWLSFGRAMGDIPQARHRWVTKMVSGHFAHSNNMVRWHQRMSSACPRCNHPLEDKVHILKCHAPMAKEKWTNSVAALQQWMKEAGTDPLLITLLISQLQAWYNNAPLSTDTIPLIDQQQSAIGWDQLVNGWLSKAW